MKRVLILESRFSSAHLYKNDSFSKKENAKNFGRCFTEHGHGHNYKIELGLKIPATLSDAKLLKLKTYWQQTLDKETRRLDHEHLNFVIPEFKKTIPTTENILLYFEKKFSGLGLKKHIAYLKLFEMENLWSEKYYVTI